MARSTGSVGDQLRDWLGAAGVLLVLACLVSGVAASSARAVGELTYDQCFGESTGCTALTGTALRGALSVAVSPNGKSVYVAGANLTHFFVGSSGGLSYDGCFNDDGSAGCQSVPGNGRQLLNPSGVAVSPNSDSVYTANGGGTVAHLFANAQGTLSWDGCVSDDGTGGLCADVPGNGDPFAFPESVAVSPNGASVYAVSPTGDGGSSGTLSHLFANPSQGQLSWDGCVSNDGSAGTCLDVPGGGSPLSEVESVAVSPNGASVYAAGSNAVSHLFANPSQGQLSWDGCVSDDGSGGTCADIPGGGKPLLGTTSIAIAPNGASVYVSNEFGTLSHLTANPSQGQLTWAGCVSDDGSGGTCADLPGSGSPLSGAAGPGQEIAMSPDGRSLYFVSDGSSSLVVFDVGQQGQLTFKQCLSDGGIAGCTNPPGNPLDSASGVAVSPDGRSVYVTGNRHDSTSGTLARFTRATTAGLLTRTATATIGNQRVRLSTRLPSSCVAKTRSLTAKLSSSAIPGSHASHVRFARADFYIDRGVRHVHNKTVTYTPNEVRHQQPTSVTFKLGNLSAGTHTLRVKVFFLKTVTKQGHRRTVTVSTALQIKFKVC